MIKRLFKTKTSIPEASIRFGRYCDIDKTEQQQAAWNKAIASFEDRSYIASYQHLLDFLTDEGQDNIRYTKNKGRLEFVILQGSRKIIGFADHQKCSAEARIAKIIENNSDTFRHLLSRNFDLKYGKYSIDDTNNISIIFSTSHLDASPYKLREALKELATNADKLDDLLLERSDLFATPDEVNIRPVKEHEKLTKYRFILNQIDRTLAYIKHNSADTKIALYYLLGLAYKLDYLIVPQGEMMETLERMHRIAFAKDPETSGKNIALLKEELQQLKERPRSAFFKEMYHTSSTFGIMPVASIQEIHSMIESEMINLHWYLEQEQEAVAKAASNFVVGYCLFNFGMHSSLRDLFLLYYKITEPGFFRDLGFGQPLVRAKNNFDKKRIKAKMKETGEGLKGVSPGIEIDTSFLNFTSLSHFCVSYLEVLSKMLTFEK